MPSAVESAMSSIHSLYIVFRVASEICVNAKMLLVLEGFVVL